MSATEKRQQVVKSHPRLSLLKQCNILEIHRTSLYYRPRGELFEFLQIDEGIDKKFLEHPYYGERMNTYLNRVNQLSRQCKASEHLPSL